jgi:uncharacterized protein YmfQ (DUF2313 family)
MTNGFVPSPPQQPTQALPLDYAPLSPAIPDDRHIRRGQEEYSWALSALLPQGIAWPRWRESTFMKVVYGLSGGMGWADGRAADLLERESDPRQTVEMLDSWERAWGLPDPCYQGPQSIVERQTALIQRMTLLGAQSREFFIGVADWLGYPISISEYRPFMVGVDRCGDNRIQRADGTLSEWPCQIGNPTMRFAWTVHIEETKLVWFQAGSGQAGIDPHLRIVKAEDLECVIRRWAPAHTQVLFDYSGIADPFAGAAQHYIITRGADQIVARDGTQIISHRANQVYWTQPPAPYSLGSPSMPMPLLIVSEPPYDPSTQAWLNSVSLRGGTPTGRQITQTDLLIQGLKADGLWPIIDRLWLFASESNEPIATVDIMQGGVLTNNGCTWQARVGYSSPAATLNYIDSNFDPTAVAFVPKFARNNAMIGVWTAGGPQHPDNWLCGTTGTTLRTFINLLEDGLHYFAINDSISAGFVASTVDAYGFFSVTRVGPTNSQAFHNGLPLTFSSNPSAAPVTAPITFCGGYGNVSHWPVSIGVIAGGMTEAQMAALYTRLRNYLIGIGNNPGTPPVPTP